MRRLNKQFRKMTPSRQRMCIARDVLGQLATKKIIAELRTFVEDALLRDKALFKGTGLRSSDQVRDLLSTVKSCNACALGSMFACLVDRADQLTPGDIGRAFKGDRVEMRSEYLETIFKYMERYFSRRQIGLIEMAFERGGGYFSGRLWDPEEYAACTMFEASTPPRRRLEVIMKNVIKNDGDFIVVNAA